jgi:hypothetical protein
MPDNNPKLTAQLQNTRGALMAERTNILQHMAELRAVLDMNSTQIEAADTLMLRFNPEHIALDVRSGPVAAPMVVVGRSALQLGSSVSEIAMAKPQASVETSKKASAPSPVPSRKIKGKKVPKRKLTVEEQIAAVDAAFAAKPERNPVSQAITDYFQKSGRNDTILKILESKGEPVNAATVAKDYKALYPLPEDTAEMRNLLSSRVSSALYYLKDRGQTTRIAAERTDGRPAENVRWELSKSYRSEARKARAARTKANDHSALDAQPMDDGVRLSGTAH